MSLGSPILLRDAKMQSDLDANHYRIINLDTSNLPPGGTPPTVICPPHYFLRSWDAQTMEWGYQRPAFTDLTGYLTTDQMSRITQVGIVRSGTWQGSIIGNTYLPTLDGIRSPVANVGISNYRITNLGDPVDEADAVNLRTALQIANGFVIKQPVVATSQSYVEPVGLRPVDGYQIQAGDRVLLVAQGLAPGRAWQNGVWIAAVNAWTRATDMDSESEFVNAVVPVLYGNTLSGSTWFQHTVPPIDFTNSGIGTPPYFWLLSGPTQIHAGYGLYYIGNTLNVQGTQNRIVVGSAVDIASTYIGQASIEHLGTITQGVWHGNVLDGEYGGTGVANTGRSLTLDGVDFVVSLAVGAVGTPALTLLVTNFSEVTMPVNGTLSTLNGSETLTNKRITKRTLKIASNDQPTINTDALDSFYITALAVDITSMTANLSGTPTDSEAFIIWIKDNGLSRAITWGAKFTASADLPLPTATSAGYWLFLKFHYSTELSQWVLTTKLNHI